MHAIHSEVHVEHFDRDQKIASVGKEADTSVESCHADARVHGLSAVCEDAHSPLAQPLCTLESRTARRAQPCRDWAKN